MEHKGSLWPRVTCVTCVFWRAHARVVVDSIHAGRVVLTVVILTVVDVDLTCVALEALWTNTPEKYVRSCTCT